MDRHVSKKGFLNLLSGVQLEYKYIFRNADLFYYWMEVVLH